MRLGGKFVLFLLNDERRCCCCTILQHNGLVCMGLSIVCVVRGSVIYTVLSNLVHSRRSSCYCSRLPFSKCQWVYQISVIDESMSPVKEMNSRNKECIVSVYWEKMWFTPLYRNTVLSNYLTLFNVSDVQVVACMNREFYWQNWSMDRWKNLNDQVIIIFVI